MILKAVLSKNGVSIRLTSERWFHITTSHREIDPKSYFSILDVVKDPDLILKGDLRELLAVKKKTRKDTWIVVAYKEVSLKDGFILTAYFTTDSRWLFRREVVWSKE